MSRFNRSLMATALFAGVAAIGLTPALAETTPGPAGPAAQNQAHRHAQARMTPGQLVAGRIAFMKAELKITPAQEGQWQPFAAAMRQNAQALDQLIATARQHRGAAGSAVDRMEMRAQFAKVRADNMARLASAFRPLYASLSSEQQQTANALMRHEGWHHGWHHRA
jgi:periplasmic protein CpxP/Spy